MCKNKHIHLGIAWIVAMAAFLIPGPLLANPCSVSDPDGLGPNTLPYRVTQHNEYGSCSYSGEHLIYFAEALDGEEIVLTQKLIISRADLTIGDSVVAVSIDATAVAADCVFQCNQPTDFVNITEISVCEGVQAFCNSNCQGSVNVSEVVGCVDCEDTGLPDFDGDGACDIGPSPDNCLDTVNPSQSDTDNDGVGNACDVCPNNVDPSQADFDNDGVGDACDNCPYEHNFKQQDFDGDDVGNICDNCPLQSNGKQIDFDGDGLGNICDAYPFDPYNQEEGCVPADDSDGDGFCNDDDAFPYDPSEQYDADGDGIGNNSDNCPNIPNPYQIDSDWDGEGDACDDADDLPADDGNDSDGIDPAVDNCPDVYNPTQADVDGDGLGDACDTEVCGEDLNGNGIGDACDEIGDDADGDGVPDGLEISANCDPGNADTDNDGLEDGAELMNDLFCDNPDSDGDGVLDGIEGVADTDGDGKINALDTDADGDGIPDGIEMQYGSGDADGDGVPNFLDTDSDNDGIPDTNERLSDADFDGIPDFVDAEFDPSASQNAGDGANDYYEGTAGNGCSLNVASKKPPPFFSMFLFALFFWCVFRVFHNRYLKPVEKYRDPRGGPRWYYSVVSPTENTERDRTTMGDIFQQVPFVLIFLLLLTACGGNEDIPDLTSDADISTFFPHGLHWREPVNHGTTALTLFQQGHDVPFGESCQGCHGENFEGGSGPSCYNCHAIFPHAWQQWTDTGSSEFHGIVALNNGMFETCGTQCHGTDLNGGLTGKSCYSCHPVAPHVVENPNIQNYFTTANSIWRDFDVHGAFAIANNAVQEGMCATNCHGRDYTGGLTGRSCFDCHEPYPHVAQSDNWRNDHRTYVNANTDATCITENGCHTNKNFGPTTVEQSCTDYCHVEREGL